MKKFLSLLTLVMTMFTTAWADTVVLSSPSESGSIHSDAAGIITISDVQEKGGIQTGSGSLSYGSGSATPMKLSGSRQFSLSYSNDVTISKVMLYATSNKAETATLGVSSSDRTSLGTLPVKGETPIAIDITGVTGLNASAQFLAIIVVEYSSTQPSLTVDPKELEFALNPNVPSKSAKFTLTGKNLANDGDYSLTLPNLAGLSVDPVTFTVAEGAVNQEFTVTYASTEDVAKATTRIIATVGDLSAAVAVTYQSRATAYTQTVVGSDAAWDWSKLTETVELTDETTPKKTEEFLLADLDDRITFTDEFGDAAAIKMEGMQFPSRGGYAQGNIIKLMTSVPGTIDVDFSNTGGNRPYRILQVNGVDTQFKSNSAEKVSATGISVPAGEIVLSGWMDDGENSAPNMLRWYKISFTAGSAPEPAEVTFDFSDPNFRNAVGEAMTDVKGYIYNETFVVDNASLQITAGSAPSRIYVDSNRGQCLVTYKEYTTLTFNAPEGYAITKIDFIAAGNSNINNFSASTGEIEGMTWTGNAEGVRFAQGGTSYLAKAVVTLLAKDDATTALPAIMYTECANIAAFNALEAGTYAKVTLTDVEVTGVSADGYSTAWIQDATGGCWIQYTSLNAGMKEMTKGNGYVYVVKRLVSGNPQMKETEDTPNSKIEGGDIDQYTMVEGTIAEVNVAENLNKVVKISGATLEETSATAGKLTQGEVTIDVNNGTETANQQLHKIADWAKGNKLENVTVVAILVAKSATANQLLPISIEEGTTTGISDINATAAEQLNIFNVQGVRLNQLQRGLNIVNGRKVVVK